MSTSAILTREYLHLLLMVLVGFLATWLITVLPSFAGVSPSIAVVATATVSLLLLAWAYEKVTHYSDFLRLLIYVSGQTAFLTCALILWEFSWLPQSMLDYRPHLGSLYDLIVLDGIAIGVELYAFIYLFHGFTPKVGAVLGITLIGGLVSVWLVWQLSTTFGWNWALSIVGSFVAVALVLSIFYYAADPGDWGESIGFAMFFNVLTGIAVWFLILGNFSWLPEWLLDRRPHLMQYGGWFSAIPLTVLFVVVVSNIGKGNSSSSSWGDSGWGSRSTPGSSLGTQFSQPTPSTSYESPSMPATPTWTYQAPPSAPSYDYGAAAKVTQDQAAAWDHHKKQNPQIYGPQ